MATATQQDDDLLIIADDSSSDSSDDITFSFDITDEDDTKDVASEAQVKSEDTSIEINDVTPVVEDTTPVIEEVHIDMWEEVSAAKEENTWIELETSEESSKEETPKIEMSTPEVSESSDADFSLNLDLSAGDAEVTQEEAPKAETLSEDFSLGLGWEEVIQEVIPAQEGETQATSGESLNDILAGTIAKLEARKDVIAADKATKTQKEEDIKAQIKKLEEEYAELESEMKTLDSESEKIAANITQLEGMKLDPVKEHNAKRIAKK